MQTSVDLERCCASGYQPGMKTNTFQTLCEGLCDLLQEPRFELPETLEGTIAFHLNLQAVAVNFLYFPETCADHLFILTEFGAVPENDPRAIDMFKALMDANFVLPHPNPPTMSRNPVTGEMVLRCVQPFEGATSAGLLEVVRHAVAAALEWRKTFFLGPGLPSPVGHEVNASREFA
ncbi:CesT family type III secretion system chaperone [Caenimonas koreensis]|uniref:CesT family type III secretion system chaperone n=1 Tax=Caenimonas koreensis TaxID=367474 RepID=UPI00378446FF